MATLLNKFKKERGADNSLPSFDSGGEYQELFKAFQKGLGLENNNKYKGRNPNSSAVGKYQFLWKEWAPEIKKATGILSKNDFENSPKAQEDFFKYYFKHHVYNQAKDIQKTDKLGLRLDEIAALVHFQGYGKAKDVSQKGKHLSKTFINPSTSEYINRFNENLGKPTINTQNTTSEYEDNYNQALTDFSSVAKSYAEAMSIMSGQQVSEEDVKKRLKSEKDLLVLDAQVKAMQLAEEGKKRQMEADKLGREVLEKEAEQEALKKQQEAEAIYLAKKEQSDRENASVEAYAKSFESGVKLDEKIFASSGSAQPFNFQTRQNIGVAQKGGVISEAFNKPNLFNFKQKYNL